MRVTVALASARRYPDRMARKYAIYSPPKGTKLPHLVAIIKNGKLKDGFAAESHDEAEQLMRKIKVRAEARGD